MCQANDHEGPTAPEPASIAVEAIELHYSKLDGDHLKNLLRACKALQTFIYDMGDTWAEVDVTTPPIEQALRSQRASLTHVSLTHDYELCPFDEDGGGPGNPKHAPPINLRDMQVLAALRIAPIYLFGMRVRDAKPSNKKLARTAQTTLAESLPASLTRLILSNATEVVEKAHLRAAVVSLLEGYRATVPLLEELVLEGNFDGVDDAREQAEPVVEAAARVGVTCTIVQDGEERTSPASPWGMDRDVHWGGYVSSEQE